MKLNQCSVPIAIAGATAILLVGCARNPAARTSENGGAAAGSVANSAAQSATSAHLACLDGLRSYRFGGTMSLRTGPGSTSQQLGSLVNLLQDVRFSGLAVAPSASTLDLTFGGANGGQSLQTLRNRDQLYVKGQDGKYQPSTGSGPILSALGQLDPQTLCNQTIAMLSTAGMAPVRESISGVATNRYSFTAAQLAQSPGAFGRRESDGGSGAATLDVWETVRDQHPARIHLVSGFGGTDGGTLDVTIDIKDANGADIAIKAPS